MPQNGTIIRVLIASPGDCDHERVLVPNLLYEWNAAHSLQKALILEPVKWETHAYPEFGDRPQGIINKQLVNNCDILIGTFWTRLGTNTGKADSGTAEEIDEFLSKGKDVLLYFSSAPIRPDRIDQAQYKALLEYKSRIRNDGIQFSYETLDELQKILRGHLIQVVEKVLTTFTSTKQANNLSSRTLGDPKSNESSSFLRKLKVEWVSERDSGPSNLNEGKSILSNALEWINDFRSRIPFDDEIVTKTLDEVLISLRQLKRHQLYGDGGRSYREFWVQGDILISKLEDVLTRLTNSNP